MATPGKEGQVIANGAWAGNVIGVFTSGGDSQGMSAFFLHILNLISLCFVVVFLFAVKESCARVGADFMCAYMAYPLQCIVQPSQPD